MFRLLTVLFVKFVFNRDVALLSDSVPLPSPSGRETIYSTSNPDYLKACDTVACSAPFKLEEKEISIPTTRNPHYSKLKVITLNCMEHCWELHGIFWSAVAMAPFSNKHVTNVHHSAFRFIGYELHVGVCYAIRGGVNDDDGRENVI